MPPKRKRDLQSERNRVSSEIEEHGNIETWSCLRCFNSGSECFKMESSSTDKCSKCFKQGKECVSISWPVLDKMRNDLKKAVSDDEAKLAQVNEEVRKMMEEVVRRQEEMSATLKRIERNRNTLLRAQNRAKAKTECLATELENEEKEEREKKRKRGSAEAEVGSPSFVGAPDFSDAVGWPDGSNPIDWDTWDSLGAPLGPMSSDEAVA